MDSKYLHLDAYNDYDASNKGPGRVERTEFRKKSMKVTLKQKKNQD